MNKVNWDEITETEGGEFQRPEPGGYIARITNVEDMEEKEYLRIEWDFAEGEYKGINQDTYDRAGFWPTVLIRSYKPKALGFFKAFKTALEVSNQGYHFDEDNLNAMIGKRFGVVLGEEEYESNAGEIKTRLRVVWTRSVKAIQDGDYDIPKLKTLSNGNKRQAVTTPSTSTFSDFQDANGDLPF